MNITEFISRLKAYVESHTPNYQDGDAETLLEMLFNVYTEFTDSITRLSGRTSITFTQP